MNANKIEMNGEVILDLSEDTVTEDDVADGKTFHLPNGEQAVGRMVGSTQGTDDHTHARYLFSEGNFLVSGADLAEGCGTLTVASEVEETNYIKVSETLTSGALVGRWVLITSKRAYVGTNTTNQLALYTDETKTNPMNYICPAGTVIYPADVCIDVATEGDLRELDARILECTGVKVANGIVYPYMSPNLAGEVFSLQTNGEIQDTSYVKFKGAASPLSTNSLAGRWVLIDGKRAYVGSNTVNTLVLYTDETKGNPMNYSCPSGTTIYPADVLVVDLSYVKNLIPSAGGVVVVNCNGYAGSNGTASHTSTAIKSYIESSNLVLLIHNGKCLTYKGWDDATQTAQFVSTEVGDQGEIISYFVNIDSQGKFTSGSTEHSVGSTESLTFTYEDDTQRTIEVYVK